MRTILLIIIILFTSLSVEAAINDKTITGNVIDENIDAVVGCIVQPNGVHNIRVITDYNGYYSITVSDSTKALRFSYLGFKTEIVQIENKFVVIAVMKLDDLSLDEVVVTAVATPRSSQTLSYSVSSVSADALSNTESYDVISENIFKSPLKQPLSTFSVDVDKASYSNARRYLYDNKIPPKDAIRIEEFINYFSYEYPEPKEKAPFSITIEAGNCTWKEGHYLMSIGLKGKDIELKDRPLSNIVFLLDVSGSMDSSNKLPLLQKAFKILLNYLGKDDKVAIVVYAGAAGVVLPATSCNEKEKIRKALDDLNAGGSTAGGEGIELAYKIAKENFIKNGNNRVILATDGDFNIGKSSDANMVRLIETKRDDDIFLTVLGFGMGNYKDSKMEQLSNAGNGNYAYIDNVMEAQKTLGKESFGTLYTIAKDVKIQVEFNPSKVKAYRLIGYENRLLNAEDFNDDTKDAGEIGSGHTVTAIYEIIPANSDETIDGVDDLEYQSVTINKSDNLATVKLRYKKPNGIFSKLIKKKIKFEDINQDKNSADFRFAASVIQFGMLLRDSEFKGTSTFDDVIKRAKSAKDDDDDGQRAEFIRLVELAKLIISDYEED